MALRCRLLLSESFGWCNHVEQGLSSWFKGYVWIEGRVVWGREAAEKLAMMLLVDVEQVAERLRSLEGHFAIAIETSDRTVVATDPIRSIPLFWAAVGRLTLVSADASRLLSQLPDKSTDQDALLQVAMSGYTLRDRTLYEGLRQLQAGEFAVIQEGRVERVRYKKYQAWSNVRSDSRDTLRKDLVASHVEMFDRLKQGLDDRPVFVPLSGGLDSRLIACGLSRVGYRDVTCFAYGRPNNFEALKSREVAESLGYKWLFLPYEPATVRNFLTSSIWHEHMKMADSCGSLPFIQDLFAIHQMRVSKNVPDDAVFINGQSGDFITGNHVPEAFAQSLKGESEQIRRQRIQDALIGKHFSLWRDLKTEPFLARIRAAIDEIISDLIPGGFETSEDHGVYEAIEFQERQAKFVVSGQRVYEFFGYDWRLPLWDQSYCALFERMPLSAKLGQSLFREVLMEENWGGVWRPLLPKRIVTPSYARWLRMAASVPVKLVGGQSAWRDFDRRFFLHMTDPLCIVHTVPWKEAIFDRRGFKHGVSFRCRQYLVRHGFNINSSDDLQRAT